MAEQGDAMYQAALAAARAHLEEAVRRAGICLEDIGVKIIAVKNEADGGAYPDCGCPRSQPDGLA